jgi:flagellar motility protein MotE (MotC chaperone)
VKDKLIVIMVYTLTFAAVTAGIIFLNQKYENIFTFDFRPAKSKINIDLKKPEYKTAVAALEKEIRKKLIDSLKNANALNEFSSKFVDNTPVLKDSISLLKKKLLKISEAQKKDSLLAANMKSQSGKKEYEEWLKKTAALYNTMESSQAAKIIKKYSDNVARDIIYKLKKQKAAEILAMMNPDEATKITKATK